MERRWRSNRADRKLIDDINKTKVQDGNKTIIKCSACNKDLIEIWVVRPIKMVSDIVVNCPFCGDKSFKTKIDGQFCLGHLDDTVIVDAQPENMDVLDEVFQQTVSVTIKEDK